MKKRFTPGFLFLGTAITFSLVASSALACGAHAAGTVVVAPTYPVAPVGAVVTYGVVSHGKRMRRGRRGHYRDHHAYTQARIERTRRKIARQHRKALKRHRKAMRRHQRRLAKMQRHHNMRGGHRRGHVYMGPHPGYVQRSPRGQVLPPHPAASCNRCDRNNRRMRRDRRGLDDRVAQNAPPPPGPRSRRWVRDM